MSVNVVIREVNRLRALRTHLEAQVEAEADTQYGTLAEAELALATVELDLERAESEARDFPEADYLFGRRKRRKVLQMGTGGNVQSSPQSCEQPKSTHDPKEANMARKSKTAQLEEIQVALKKAEKCAGSTKWALSGKGAEKNPPSKERKAHLTEKLAKEQATIAELRSQRDALKA